ncbi:MFS transporter [Galactobacter sp.]|uniref:MFS transporter n=1 Tax=Galactobacter sp. TaxID=2676125 RepID=UPI0025C3C8B4|nr:MFS transporter [Galactobacter sp.]
MSTPNTMPRSGRAALRAGVVGNWIDNIHVFLPLTALSPALAVVAGPGVAASAGAVIVIAMMLGRPLGGVIFGRIADRLGRTATTRIAIAGTALCALLIAAMPTHELLGGGTIACILVLRFLGGIFVAGEYSAAIPLAMEWSKPRKRGLMSGLILSMAAWAQAAIAFCTAAMILWLGPDTYALWGWRAMFVFGALLSLGMLVYYSRNVTDAPNFHRAHAEADQEARAEVAPDSVSTTNARARSTAGTTTHPRKVSLRDLLAGRWAKPFWTAFILMTGLWLLTNSTVIILTSRLASDAGLPPTGVGIAMGCASVAQAVFMAVAGHLSSFTGRRKLFVLWGASASVLGPVLWWTAINSTSLWTAALLAAVLQVATVAAYGPVASYLSELFPARLRSTGYGSAYSLSLILPALYPFYLPWLESWMGPRAAVMGFVALGGILVIVGALCGPRLSPADQDADIDTVAHRVVESRTSTGAPSTAETDEAALPDAGSQASLQPVASAGTGAEGAGNADGGHASSGIGSVEETR